jgi:hypothetical protein
MSGHSIIALWSHPRSMSTAIERIMRARGDCICLHEPFLHYYYIHRGVRQIPNFSPDASRPTAFDAIAAAIEDAADRRPVFFKDMSYYVWPSIQDHAGFSARLINVFLIRDPRRSIISYHRLDPAVTLEEIGLEGQWRHFEWIRECTGEATIVLEAEAIQANPTTVMKALWQHVGLPYLDRAFNWKDDPLPADWAEVAGWHQEVSSSKTILPKPMESDEELKARFQAVANDSPHLHAYLAHHMPFYERLKQAARQH